MTRGGSVHERGTRLDTERIREQVARYINRHGWDVVENEEAWRQYQQRRMREDYGDDEW